MTEKVDIYRMGMVFKKYLANGGVHFLGHDGGGSDFDTTEHLRYNTVRVASMRQAGQAALGAVLPPPVRWAHFGRDFSYTYPPHERERVRVSTTASRERLSPAVVLLVSTNR